MQQVDDEDTNTYRVVVNGDDQYSIWPIGKDIPMGWVEVGKVGSKSECLAFIDEVWTDMRPRSLRERMEGNHS